MRLFLWYTGWAVFLESDALVSVILASMEISQPVTPWASVLPLVGWVVARIKVAFLVEICHRKSTACIRRPAEKAHRTLRWVSPRPGGSWQLRSQGLPATPSPGRKKSRGCGLGAPVSRGLLVRAALLPFLPEVPGCSSGSANSRAPRGL